MILLDDNIVTPKGIMYRGGVKLLRKQGSYYIIKKEGLVAYAHRAQLRFLKEKHVNKR